MKKYEILQAIIILIFIFGAAAVKTSAQAKTAEKPLPNLTLDTISGEKWSLNESRGRVVLMNFWATWCEPCRAETPMLVELNKKYKTRGLTTVGIALDEDGAAIIKKFVREYKIDYPILLPVPKSRLAQIDPVPTTLLIDREGRLAKKYVGAIEEDVLQSDIEELIEKAQPKPSKK